ncbi:S8 family serine peptidase [Zavarzinia aquatilis]|uniref:Furin n=1 Tax=Zavarzinia aquatilis TaxID=2211142 RepID=A0A317DX62_9PROT|nr:S8 family serine peptidase [Zavarzinia aquatilis]PWR17533.1 furin [Zavarzinia aquatilis]
MPETPPPSDLIQPTLNLSSLLASLFRSEWHYGATDIFGQVNPWSVPLKDLWKDYTGAGVTVGIIDQGFDTDHVDLVGRFSLALSYDPRDATTAQSIMPDSTADQHGTWVAGLIGAAQSDDTGLVGGAPGSTLAGFYARFGAGGSLRSEIASLLSRQDAVDVTNCSWGVVNPFADNFRMSWYADTKTAIDHALTTGRDGQGTVFVFAAGNDRQYVPGSTSSDGDNTNNHSFTNYRGVVTVAASDYYGHVADFSTPGASILVTAPGASILTTNYSGSATLSLLDDYSYVSGTSFAAPIVTSVISLMLEANPDLGYRDVQAILAATAKGIDVNGGSWERNGATTWNGGGYHVSHDFGFGLVDARAAVRLAETWTPEGNRATEVALTAQTALSVPASIPDHGSLTLTTTIDAGAAAGLSIDWVEVDLVSNHSFVGDLVVHLISPDGTDSILVDRPGGGTLSTSGLNFTFSTNHAWGESPAGTWSLVVEDQGYGGTGSVVSWSLRVYGSDQGDDNTYIFTDEFARYGADMPALNDTAGIDTLNAAAVSSAVTIDLRPGRITTIAGHELPMAAETSIENAIGGEKSDILYGSNSDNDLQGARGNDTLYGFRGDDHLSGGQGDDVLNGGDGADTLMGDDGADRLDGGSGNDLLDGGAGNDVLRGGDGDDTIIGGAGSDSLYGLAGDDTIDGGADADRILGGDGADRISGGDGADRLSGEAGNDWLDGGAGNDLLDGGDDSDTLFGGAGKDTMRGGAGDDSLAGGDDADTLSGDAGRDRLEGGGANDRLDGGADNDTLFGNDGDDLIYGGTGDDVIAGNAGRDRLYGDEGADLFVFSRGDGADRVLDFSSAEQDRVRLDGFGFTDTDMALSHAVARSGGVNFTFGDGDSLWVAGATLADAQDWLLIA